MSFKSLRQVLGFLENQDSWKGRRQFQQILACWFEVVGPAVAAQTRPVSMQRRVLQVATSSAAWAQNLAFERHRILEKLNARLPLGLTDVRFSTAHWQSEYGQVSSMPLSETARLWQEHPSRVADVPTPKGISLPEIPDPQAAFRNWARVVRLRSQNLPLCPTCQCPTPAGELDRWAICALCAAKKMGERSGEIQEPGARNS